MLKKVIQQTIFSRAPIVPIRGFSKLAKFDYQDPLNFDSLLSEEEKMIRDAARDFCQDKLMSRVRKHYNDEYFDPEIMREYGA